jgi:hypothetical protein
VTDDHLPVPARREPPAGPPPERPSGGPGDRPTTVRVVAPAEPWPIAAIDRAWRFLRAVARSVLRLAGVALLGGLAVWWALFRGLDPGQGRTAGLVVAALLLLAPPVILGLFVVALRALADVPRRVQEAPASFRQKADEMRRRVGEVSAAGGTSRSLGSLYRLWRAGASWRELLEVVSPGLFLLTPAMLVASVVAALAALLEILAGAIAAIWLAVA